MGVQLYPGATSPRTIQAAVVAHLVRGWPRTDGYRTERAYRSFPGRNVPDVTVLRGDDLVHFFKVVPPGTVTADQVRHSWSPLACWAQALGTQFWVLVPAELRPFAEELAATCGVDLRLGGYRVDDDGAVRLEW